MYDNKLERDGQSPGARIRALRLARGWSLAELARRAGTSAPTLHRYEGGWDRFELATLRKIASALGARLEVKLVREDTPTEVRSPARLRRILAPLFWDRDLQQSDLEQYTDWVLERVLMFGNREQVQAARRFYGDDAVASAAGRRGVDPRTRNYWRTILGGGAVASEGA